MRSLLPHRLRLLTMVALAALLAVLAVPSASAEAQPSGDPADGATEQPLPATALTFRVDGSFSVQDVWPDGSLELPFPTVGWAIAATESLRAAGQPVRIVVAPGTYRERVKITGTGADAPLVLESEEPGGAVITGADVEDRWTPVAGTPLARAPWTANWGLAPIPGSWGDAVAPSDGVRRREAMFVDGEPLVQVLRFEDLVPGSFLVDETGDAIYAHPPAGASPDLSGNLVEVATRARVLDIGNGAANVTVRGFTFQAGAAPFTKFMANVSESTDVVVEQNTFRHSSWGGLFVCCTEGVTVRDNVSEANGGNGIDTYRAHDVVVQGNVATGNNVRGARNGYLGWSVAGSKNMLLHGAVFRDNVWDGNWARGLWFDTDVVDVLVDGDRSCGNARDGVFLEALAGPITIRNSTFCGNARAGVIVSSAGGVTLEGSTLADNPYGQLVFSGERLRTWTNHVTGTPELVQDFTDWTLRDNVLQSDATNSPLVFSPVLTQAEWRAKLSAGEVRASGTIWDHPSIAEAIIIYGKAFSIAEWNSLTGDGTATADPAPEPVVEEPTDPSTSRGNSGKGDKSGPPQGKGPRS
ncbi:MAG TPA: right-handed parallel beta-helix repeat-containing protein [Acidimicrobiales bacterium]|nr:right-handed parallel beta-helix repeat-containing protein [Acidimicrobiales bacterium]